MIDITSEYMSMLLMSMNSHSICQTQVVACSFDYIINVICKIATVIIAGVNLYFVYRLHSFQKNTHEQQKKQDKNDRRIGLLRTLVLDSQLTVMYRCFSKLNEQLVKLKNKSANKKLIEEEMQKIFKELNENFIFFVDSIVPNLGEKIKKDADDMLDKLVENIFDDGVNLWVEKYFDDKIGSVLNEGRKSIINKLFEYNGE